MTSITNSAINAITQNPDSNSWTKIIIPVILAGLIGYLLAKQRDKSILKQKLETETVDELLRLSWITNNDLSKIYTENYISYFSNYNEKLNTLKDSILSKEPMMNIDFQQSQLDIIKTNIDNYINQLINSTLKYHRSALELIHYIESRRIILIGFKIFVDEIISKHNQQRNEMDLLTEKTYRFYLKNKFNKNENLSQSDFNTLNDCFTNITKTVDSLGTYYYDLDIALQNEFISKLYGNIKIRERNPQDPYYKVLKIDKTNKW